MNRRNFLQAGGLAAATSGLSARMASPFVPAHNWDRYDFGLGPTISDRLNQGPFLNIRRKRYSLEARY